MSVVTAFSELAADKHLGKPKCTFTHDTEQSRGVGCEWEGGLRHMLVLERKTPDSEIAGMVSALNDWIASPT